MQRDAAAFDVERATLALWAKSPADGEPAHLLVQHLLDTAAVGELLWDRHLPGELRAAFDAVAAGRGRALFAFIAGVHDVGKATPIFQNQRPDLLAPIREAGLTIRNLSPRPSAWHHTRAGAAALRWVGESSPWPAGAADWMWPLVAGHHGRVPDVAAVRPSALTGDDGDARWALVRARLVRTVAEAVGFAPGADGPVGRPSRGSQLAALGYIVMADWVASNRRAFPAVGSLPGDPMQRARERAAVGWEALELGRAWRPGSPDGLDLIRRRFSVPARPLQALAIDAASAMESPGLLIVEAPMGEGKTEAALAAAEVLAHRFGARGVFVGMPTQATADPMFERVRDWSRSAAAGVPIALLHGRRMFNPAWRALLGRVSVAGVDSVSPEGSAQPAASDWFLGRKRGLLAPLVIATVDNLLLAGARTPHVMLRHAGLAQKVVVLDEVHAASAYMAQYLAEALRWLGSSRAPVVLLTATLPPALRVQLAAAYLEGAHEAAGHPRPGAAARDIAAALRDLPGYPGVATACVAASGASVRTGSATAWRPSARVAVEILGGLDEGGLAIADLLADALSAGGCALVIRNTVGSAQRTFATLRGRFGDDVGLLHARLLAGERASRATRELRCLGPAAGESRPRRRILVATQVAEQSFDIDADLLVSDIAPIDLLLQRAGRLHRHDRSERPARLSSPRLVVAGVAVRAGAAPEFGRGSIAVYRRHRLIRAAALVVAAAARGWDVPADVPGLVAAAYGDARVVPPEWSAEAERAASEEAAWLAQLEATARQGLLSPAGGFAAPTLAGLHRLERPDDQDDALAVEGIVREGEQSAEVVLVRRAGAGALDTMGGRPLTREGLLVADEVAVEEAMASLLRLPGQPRVTAAARALAPDPAMGSDPLLAGLRPVAVGADGRFSVGADNFRYDDELGLVSSATDAQISMEARP